MDEVSVGRGDNHNGEGTDMFGEFVIELAITLDDLFLSLFYTTDHLLLSAIFEESTLYQIEVFS